MTLKDAMVFPFRERLMESLRALSADATSQVEYLRLIGGKPELYLPADELALEYDDLSRLLDQYAKDTGISQLAVEHILALDGHFDKMTASKNEHLWTYEALRNSPEWHEVRQRAKNCLELLFVPGNFDAPTSGGPPPSKGEPSATVGRNDPCP